MNNRIDFSNLGGFPMTQYTADWMQKSFRNCFGAIANLLGDKVIVYGCDLVGANVTDGWICVNGELMPFTGAALGTGFITINEAVETRAFQDTNVYNAYFTKTATLGVAGAFLYSDLKKISTLKNTELSGELKMMHVDNVYIAANFDVNGYGLNMHQGWRILSKAYPNTAGKTFVNIDPLDADFDTVSKIKGTKQVTLVVANLPSHDHPRNPGSGPMLDMTVLPGSGTADVTGGNKFKQLNNVRTGSTGGGTAFDIMQPSYTILTLIKL